jgi:hypothetical protein
MDDSKDLRKRILKMRENNNFTLNTEQSDLLQKDVRTKVKLEDIKIQNEEKLNFTNINEELTDDTDVIEPSLLKKKVTIQTSPVNQDTDKNSRYSLLNANEAQFRILANKFNEAVEVILELSDKVKKLEHKVYKNDNKIMKGNTFFYYINLKVLFSLILIPLLILGFLKLPFDLFTIKLIFSDIFSSM